MASRQCEGDGIVHVLVGWMDDGGGMCALPVDDRETKW
jgi:hypothetical protein